MILCIFGLEDSFEGSMSGSGILFDGEGVFSLVDQRFLCSCSKCPSSIAVFIEDDLQ